MRRRKRSPSPQRRIRRSSGLLTCCSERSKYGTPVAQMASIRRVGQVARVEVEQPDPVGALGDGLDERHDRPGAELVGRSLPYDARSWATSTISRAPSWSTSARIDVDVAAALRAAERSGWRRTRRPGRSPRRSSRRPTARSTGGRGRLSRSSIGTARPRTGISLRLGLRPTRDRHAEPGDLVDLGQRRRPARRRSARPCSR